MRLMPQSSAISLMVILFSGFCSSRCFSDASSARLVTCDMAALLFLSVLMIASRPPPVNPHLRRRAQAAITSVRSTAAPAVLPGLLFLRLARRGLQVLLLQRLDGVFARAWWRTPPRTRCPRRWPRCTTGCKTGRRCSGPRCDRCHRSPAPMPAVPTAAPVRRR